MRIQTARHNRLVLPSSLLLQTRPQLPHVPLTPTKLLFRRAKRLRNDCLKASESTVRFQLPLVINPLLNSSRLCRLTLATGWSAIPPDSPAGHPREPMSLVPRISQLALEGKQLVGSELLWTLASDAIPSRFIDNPLFFLPSNRPPCVPLYPGSAPFPQLRAIYGWLDYLSLSFSYFLVK